MFEEHCPWCDHHTIYDLKDVTSGGRVTCTHCGRRIHACSACENQCQQPGRRTCFTNSTWKAYQRDKDSEI